MFVPRLEFALVRPLHRRSNTFLHVNCSLRFLYTLTDPSHFSCPFVSLCSVSLFLSFLLPLSLIPFRLFVCGSRGVRTFLSRCPAAACSSTLACSCMSCPLFHVYPDSVVPMCSFFLMVACFLLAHAHFAFLLAFSGALFCFLLLDSLSSVILDHSRLLSRLWRTRG